MMDSKNGLNAGDIVRLKSGGPKMTIKGFGEKSMNQKGLAQCEWFDKEGKLTTGAFEPVSLELATEGGGAVAGGARPTQDDQLF